MAAAVHHFGIRHHGPGSARRLLAALAELRPAHVLVEGPSDLSDLLPLLADPAMVPPVALLAYAADRPGAASFWPFAEFSPEYQAIRWALANDVPVGLIDLPGGELGFKQGFLVRDPDGHVMQIVAAATKEKQLTTNQGQ